MEKYDYLIVGAGLFGSIFAYEANKRGKRCLVIEKREHIGGNIYCEKRKGINVHKYGAHIFHTSNKKVWEYINQFAQFSNYVNSPLANYKGELYNLPFNMNTFYQLWKVKTPEEAKEKIENQIKIANIKVPQNLEEQAISLVGVDIYTKLIKGYTEKQWGIKASQLPTFIIKRLPVRFTFNNNYFNDTYQGIPIEGYNVIIEKLLDGIEVRTSCDFFENYKYFKLISKKIVFTGMIDKYYDYKYGELEYRGLKFEHEELDVENYQGNAVINYTEYEIPYTRIIEHKHFEGLNTTNTIITKEFPMKWEKDSEPYYPINNEINNAIYNKYKQRAEQEDAVIFGGRLAEYKYYDMDDIIESVLVCVEKEFKDEK